MLIVARRLLLRREPEFGRAGHVYEEMLLNTDDITAVFQYLELGADPHVSIKMRGASEFICAGAPRDFLPKEQ